MITLASVMITVLLIINFWKGDRKDGKDLVIDTVLGGTVVMTVFFIYYYCSCNYTLNYNRLSVSFRQQHEQSPRVRTIDDQRVEPEIVQSVAGPSSMSTTPDPPGLLSPENYENFSKARAYCPDLSDIIEASETSNMSSSRATTTNSRCR